MNTLAMLGYALVGDLWTTFNEACRAENVPPDLVLNALLESAQTLGPNRAIAALQQEMALAAFQEADNP